MACLSEPVSKRSYVNSKFRMTFACFHDYPLVDLLDDVHLKKKTFNNLGYF